ncbi:MAG: glutamate-5-semialdehyde dehydrogenase [Chitinophagaceae bacterium]
MDYQQLFKSTREASRQMGLLATEKINTVLMDLAETILRQTSFILSENEKDLANMLENDPRYDRLQLNQERIASIAGDVRNVVALPSPVGIVLAENTLPNNLRISKITVPIGVIGIIYEARPNVTCDAFVLCFKTGNACVLKGGSDAEFSNIAFIKIIKEVLHKYNLDENIVNLLPAERKSTEILLEATGWVDVVIPRGSQQLIDFVRKNAKIPVIETGAGIVHTYFDETADLEKGAAIICNAKTRRVSVCNSLDCLIIHEDRLDDLPVLLKPLEEKHVEVFADPASYKALAGSYLPYLLNPASEEHFGTEFLSLKLSIKTVSSLEEALNHINTYSSRHSEAILSEDPMHIEKFLQLVDAAAVYVNASTAFTDGGEFGLGAEIGISTQKLHARGPMGLDALTSYKWLIRGDGQIRNG